MLPPLKKEYPWLKEVDSTALIAAAKNLDGAYQKFFSNVKKGEKPGFPRFKSKKNARKSYQTKNPNGKTIRFHGNKIKFLKLGLVKIKAERDIPSDHRILSATITQEGSGKYYVSVLTEYEQEIPEITPDLSTALGLDYSSPHFYVDSDGNSADMPHYYRNAEARLAREQRKLSKMQKGSNNYRKQRKRVARCSEKTRNQRKDWQQKESTRLANLHDVICMEDIILNVIDFRSISFCKLPDERHNERVQAKYKVVDYNYQDMARGLHLAKATYDNAFGQFRAFLSYKMAERGRRLITIDKWYPSSKTCRYCGSANRELTLNERTWICPNCGAEIDRDLNAAINIKNQGLLQFT
jgi:putative transposase